jgi:putative MFS transporter
LSSAPAPDGPPPRPVASDRNPWWIPPFLGRVPEEARPRIDLLGAVALALLFENYDQSMLMAALKQIAESFGIIESDLGSLLARIHLGSLLAFVLVPFADRIGRRRLFLISLIGLSLATLVSAFAQSIGQFIAFQMVSRTFMVTCSATAFVIVTEEFPAAHRGWGIGILGGLGTFGYGLGLALFAGIDYLPYGWRALYVVGMVPLLMLPWFRREVQETRRFSEQRREAAPGASGSVEIAGWLAPLWSLVRVYPGRALGIGVAGAAASASHAAAFQFSAFFVQSVHGWEPWQFTLMAFSAGLVGILGYPFVGRLADRRGRRAVGFAVLAGFPLLALAFYHSPGLALPFLWVPLIFTLTGGNTIMRTLSTELFPTSYRGTSAGFLQLVEAGGRVGGLALVAWGTPDGASTVPMISQVVLIAGIAALVVLALPETGRRELEDVSPEA